MLGFFQGSARHLTLCVDLLLQLGEPAEDLYDNFLRQARVKLEEDLNSLEEMAHPDYQPPGTDQLV